MAPSETAQPEGLTTTSADAALRHVMVVGGSLVEWAAFGESPWRDRVEALGARADRLGVRWLTIRAYEAGDGPALVGWQRTIGGCQVVVDPTADGRRRFAEAMQRLDPGDEVNEATVAAVLYEPADTEPDLVVVLGPETQLPPSLVWELAYAELVFVSAAWGEFGVAEFDAAIAEFSHRRRRFGGLDEE